MTNKQNLGLGFKLKKTNKQTHTRLSSPSLFTTLNLLRQSIIHRKHTAVKLSTIHKAQIGFKQAAGLSSFNRNDTNLPSISTIEASISSLAPSPPYLGPPLPLLSVSEKTTRASLSSVFSSLSRSLSLSVTHHHPTVVVVLRFNEAKNWGRVPPGNISIDNRNDGDEGETEAGDTAPVIGAREDEREMP